MRAPASHARLKKALTTGLLLGGVFLAAGIYWTESDDLLAAEQAAEPASALKSEENSAKATEKTEVAQEKTEVRVITREECIAHEGAVDDIRKRREELDLRAKALESREGELVAKERALEEQLKKLQELRDEIARIKSVDQQKNEAKLARIVETLEAMNPKSAAKMIAALDESLAVPALEQLTTAKLGKVMNLLEPELAARLNEVMAGVVRAKTGKTTKTPAPASVDAAETTTTAKGGEKNESTDGK